VATVRPLFTVAPEFKKVAPVVVRVLLTEVGRDKITCAVLIVFPPQLNVPKPLCARLPSTFTVERKMLDGMAAGAAGGGYIAPFTELRLILAVLMLMVLILLVLTPPLKVARPFAVNVLVAIAGPLNCALPPLTTRPA
jgi:hypothetical protein